MNTTTQGHITAGWEVSPNKTLWNIFTFDVKQVTFQYKKSKSVETVYSKTL